MLKPQRRSDFILHDFPPVFGKPWYWHRSTGVMESTRSLAQVITEMQDEIKNMEGDKRAHREEFGRQESFGDFPGQPTTPIDAGPENPYANLRRNASAPALDVQYKENNVMTVRRYSIASHMPGVNGREGSTNTSGRSDSGWGRLQEEVSQGTSLKTETQTKKQTLQDLVHKNRAKVKTVTFLLPVDDIYTNRPVRCKQQEGARDPELDSITDTDH
ncbi:unnamed protein product [Lota lota]